MRTMLVLALIGSLQCSPGQTNVTNDVTPPRHYKQLKSRTSERSPELEESKNAGRMKSDLAFDETAKPLFRAYFREVSRSVRSRWLELFDAGPLGAERTGRVVLQVNLHQDGRVSDVKVLESTGGEDLSELCQKAVLEPSPFPRWPAEMRKQVADGFRKTTLTFNLQASR